MRKIKDGRASNRDTNGRCLKRCFETKAKAVKKLKQGPLVAQRAPKHVYFCHECKSWHLTSQRRKRSPTNA